MLFDPFVRSRAWMASANTSLPARPVLACVLLVFVSCLLVSKTAQAETIIDPPNDFRTFDPGNPNSYAGPQNPGLDVLSANVILNLNLQTLTITSTMAGPISGLV